MKALVICASMIVNVNGTAFAQLQDLGQPARARNILAGLLVQDRHTGREVLVLSNNNEASGAELIFLDFNADTASVIRAPAGAGVQGLNEIPGDRLALSTFYDGSLMIFDLKKMEFVKTLQFSSQTYVWGFAIGNDGRAYCGSFPGGKLGALDLNTYVLEDLGNGAPPNYYLRIVVATPDGRILCRFITEKPTWLVFDPGLKKFETVPPELRRMHRIAVWNGYVVAGERVFDGRDFHAVPWSLAFPIQGADRPSPKGRLPGLRGRHWEFDTYLTTPETLYIREGHNLWKYDKNQKRFVLVSAVDVRGGRPLGMTSDGRIIGVRGEDYFTINPGDTVLHLRPLPGDSSPRFILFLKADPNGKIWGGPPFGQTLFWVDPLTKKIVNTSTISDIGGEVYDVAFLNGVTYAACYSGGELIRYNPDQPWDQWNQKNPRTIATISSEGYNRPTGGIIVGPGRKLYSGWAAQIGAYGGAVAITDPESGETDLLRNPLGEQQITGIATDGKLLYIGTGIGGDGLPGRPGESPKLGILDSTTKQVIWQQTIEGAERVRVVGYDSLTQLVVCIVDGRIRLFDPSVRAFLDRTQSAPIVASWSNGLPGDGRLYYGSGKQILALDLRTGVVDTLAETPGYVNNVAVGPDGTVYAGAWTHLYAVRH